MRRFFLLIIAVAVALVLAACMGSNEPSNNPETPDNEPQNNVKVYLTDAVLPIERVQSVLVTIDRILLMSDEATVVVSDEATTVNLLDLIGQELYVGSVPAGTYGQLRFEVSSATITVIEEIDGVAQPVDHALRINSGSLKVPLQGFTVEPDTSIVLDFDLSKSIKVTGPATSTGHGQGNNPVQYHMTPVIHVRYGKLYDISGRVVDAQGEGIEHALVALFETNQSSPTAVTLTHKESAKWDAGEFKLCKVRPGEYELKIYTNWESSQDPEYIFDTTPATVIGVRVQNQDVELDDIVVDVQ